MTLQILQKISQIRISIKLRPLVWIVLDKASCLSGFWRSKMPHSHRYKCEMECTSIYNNAANVAPNQPLIKASNMISAVARPCDHYGWPPRANKPRRLAKQSLVPNSTQYKNRRAVHPGIGHSACIYCRPKMLESRLSTTIATTGTSAYLVSISWATSGAPQLPLSEMLHKTEPHNAPPTTMQESRRDSTLQQAASLASLFLAWCWRGSKLDHVLSVFICVINNLVISLPQHFARALCGMQWFIMEHLRFQYIK